MTFTVTQKKEAYKKLPQEVQDFIMDNETTELIDSYLKEVGLSEEQIILADSEVLYAMFRLQSLSESLAKIAKLSNIHENDLSKLKINLENNIFNKIQNNNDGRVLGLNRFKIAEIGKKYSLDQNQVDKLTIIVDQAFIDIKKPEELLETIVLELGISKLLAEQLIEDLKTRIFEQTPKNSKTTQEKSSDNIPEIRPEITPMIEPEEKVRVRPIPVGFSGATPKSTSVPQPSAPVPSESTPELVQRPVSVPRYTGIPMEEEKRSSQEPVASSKENTGQVKTPEPVPEPVKRYTVDPYREPLE